MAGNRRESWAYHLPQPYVIINTKARDTNNLSNPAIQRQPWPAMTSAAPASMSTHRSRRAARSSSTSRKEITCLRCSGSSPATPCWCSTAAMANGGRRWRRGGKRASVARNRRADPAAERARRSALPVRAAQACPPRLHGAEGGGARRFAPAAGDDAACPGRARQPRAHARECHRSGGAVRHSDASGDRGAGRIRPACQWVRERRLLVFCDEDAAGDPVATLAATRERHAGAPPPLAVLIGPEGGFADDERAALLRLPNVVRLALGPRILRADTAAVAALALVQAVLGWRTGARTVSQARCDTRSTARRCFFGQLTIPAARRYPVALPLGLPGKRGVQ